MREFNLRIQRHHHTVGSGIVLQCLEHSLPLIVGLEAYRFMNIELAETEELISTHTLETLITATTPGRAKQNKTGRLTQLVRVCKYKSSTAHLLAKILIIFTGC